MPCFPPCLGWWVVDDVYAAVDWDISRSVDVNDGCFDGNVSGWSDSRSRFRNNGMAGSQKRAIHPTRRDFPVDSKAVLF